LWGICIVKRTTTRKDEPLKLKTCIRAAGALAALALAIPASASAVPSVTSVVAKTGDVGVTFLTDPTGAALTSTQTRYVISTDGYALGFAEDNGVTGGGVLDYSALPSAYRAPMTTEDKRTYGPAQTDVQPHATCSDVAALSSGANILAWQRSTGSDPFYNYIPWQKTSAGLGDDPATWTAVVRTATGVDLSRLAAAADLRRACEGLGGTYHAADTASAVATTLIANATAPLQRQVDALTRARAASDRAAATARDAQRLAEAAYQALFTKPIALTLAAKRFALGRGVVMITGSPTDPVDVTLEIAKKKARKLGLASNAIAEAQGVLNADGAVLLTLKPDQDTLRALVAVGARSSKARGRGKVAHRAARRVKLPARVLAVSGGNEDSAEVILTY
jgi:hypothetical protein